MLEDCEIVRCDGGSGGGGVSATTGELVSLKRGFFSSFSCFSFSSCCCCCSSPTSLTSSEEEPVVLSSMISSIYEGFRLWWSILANIRVLDESFIVLEDNNETKSQLETISSRAWIFWMGGLPRG